MTTGIALGIFPQIVNNEIIALVGMYMNVATMEEKQWVFFTIQDGVVTADQAAIDECNTYIKDLHYIGAMNYVMEGQSLTTEQLIIYDNVVKAVASVPSKAYVYLKKDDWEELYAKDFEKLANSIENVKTSLEASIDAKVDAKADKMPIKTYASHLGLQPNVYTKHSTNSTGSEIIKLANIVNNSIYNEYIIEIKCTSTPSSVDFSNSYGTKLDINWSNDNIPTFEAGYTYIISIVNNFGVFAQFANS